MTWRARVIMKKWLSHVNVPAVVLNVNPPTTVMFHPKSLSSKNIRPTVCLFLNLVPTALTC